MIREDIELSQLLFRLAQQNPELEAVTQNLSITTLRYIPTGADLKDNEMLNALNEALLNRLQKEGKMFMSNALVDGKYCLRSCVVNFRTTKKDIEEITDIIIETGRLVSKEMQQGSTISMKLHDE